MHDRHTAITSTAAKGWRSVRRGADAVLSPLAMGLVPLAMMAAFLRWGDAGLMALGVALPLLIGAAALVRWSARPQRGQDDAPGSRADVVALMDGVLAEPGTGVDGSVCLALEIDDLRALEDRLGRALLERVIAQMSERVSQAIRGRDRMARLDLARFVVATDRMPVCDLETAVQVAGRLQRTTENPFTLAGREVFLSCSVGFCITRNAPAPSGEAMVEAAQAALTDARHAGASSIRAFTAELGRQRTARDSLLMDVGRALDGGEIHPWFQPQVATDSGKLLGFEALARWSHPERGMVSPGDFLPVIEQAGLMERLGAVMLDRSLAALRAWDAAGVRVPTVGLNFSQVELANPKLAERLAWELDRHEIAPERIAVEVLESVIATSDTDVIALNLRKLSEMGCTIDLDDFGTGNSSIVTVRRFPVSRLKIDRSFVMKADKDEEQRRMLGVILHMAKELRLETLAEGVETVGEHATLAKMGCTQAQGYGIARPMPFEETVAWIDRHTQTAHKGPRGAGGTSAAPAPLPFAARR
ncbi:MAG: putative bifunctional diguanylate cyclase/phosphodiesterase [Shimia sp.]